MGSIESRLSRLEDRTLEIAAEAAWDEKLERERAITRMILDEFASLRASGLLSDDDPLAQAVHNVSAEQYAHLGEENYEYIADGWLETIREWTRLDWMVKAGRERPLACNALDVAQYRRRSVASDPAPR